jgi:hypothetical protein
MNHKLKPWDGAVADLLVVAISSSGPKSSSLDLYQIPAGAKNISDELVEAMHRGLSYYRGLSTALVKVHYVPCYVNAGVWLYGKQIFNLKAMAMYGEVLEVVNDLGVLSAQDGLLQPGEVIPLALTVQRSVDKYKLINTRIYYDCPVVGRTIRLTNDDKQSRIALRRHMLGFDPTIATMLNKDPMADIEALNLRIYDAWSDRMNDLKKSIRSTYR